MRRRRLRTFVPPSSIGSRRPEPLAGATWSWFRSGSSRALVLPAASLEVTENETGLFFWALTLIANAPAEQVPVKVPAPAGAVWTTVIVVPESQLPETRSAVGLVRSVKLRPLGAFGATVSLVAVVVRCVETLPARSVEVAITVTTPSERLEALSPATVTVPAPALAAVVPETVWVPSLRVTVTVSVASELAGGYVHRDGGGRDVGARGGRRRPRRRGCVGGLGRGRAVEAREDRRPARDGVDLVGVGRPVDGGRVGVGRGPRAARRSASRRRRRRSCGRRRSPRGWSSSSRRPRPGRCGRRGAASRSATARSPAPRRS